MAEVRGSPLILYKQYVIDNLGEDKLHNILDKMAEGNRNVFLSEMDPEKWYPLIVMQDFLDAFESVLGRNNNLKLARYTFEHQMHGFYGLISQFLTLDIVLGRFQKMWGKFYSEGTIDINKISDDSLTLEVKDLRFTEAHLYGFMFYCEAVLEKVTKKKIMTTPIQKDCLHTLFKFKLVNYNPERLASVALA